VERRGLRLPAICRQAIGIVTQAAERDSRLTGSRSDRCLECFEGLSRVDVSHTGVAAFRFARGPAHDFDAFVAQLSSLLEDFKQGEVRENGAYETELHRRDSWRFP